MPTARTGRRPARSVYDPHELAAPVVVILAAGEGTRMRSAVPKLLHPICGRPMVLWPVTAALDAGAQKVVVVDGPARALEPVLPDGVTLVVQAEPRGTGDAVRAAAAELDPDAPAIVLNGDVPLIRPETIAELIAAHSGNGAAATLVTMSLDDPGAYGRVLRAADGSVERVVEAKGGAGDATPEQLAIREVNAGVYAFDGAALIDALGKIRADNAQGEYYLPDAVTVLRAGGQRVAAHLVDDASITLGVNDRVELANVGALAQRRINEEHMRDGVTIVDPAATTIDAGVQIGRDTVIEPSTFLRGATTIGAGCRIGPLTTIEDSTIHDEVTVRHSFLTQCELHDGVTVGPFAYLRPGAVLRERAKAGTFVEIKNSDIGARTKVPHLSYVGDADVGEDTNIGAGNITANYDGRRKHRTKIGSRVKTSVDTAFVAPVTVGDDAYTGAGSVITKDVPEGALGIARERQRNVEGYAKRREEEAR
jgi:bifunctional UDP-N-acetylglucosamine pyrophosphorylase/glucosamine-1-phosphate N-acetyltransferase